MGLLTGDEFENMFESMFTTFKHTAFRFEVRERYHVSDEDDPLQRFLDGEPNDPGWIKPWTDLVTAATVAGKRFSRVRAVSTPFSDYTRFGLALSAINVAAGEDIRYLDRLRYQELGLPNHDAWIFDSAQLAVLHFDGDDRPVGGEIITSPEIVLQHCQWRDAAWHYAIARGEFSQSSGG